MKVVISCAGSKAKDAGYMKTDRRYVKFVGNPAEVDSRILLRSTDDKARDGKTWRDKHRIMSLMHPLGLLPAYKLYTPDKPYKDIYTQLVERFGINNVYILSAGWGLIHASFLTPKYDITFNGSADVYKRRRKRDQYCDFNDLESAIDERCFLADRVISDLTRHYLDQLLH